MDLFDYMKEKVQENESPLASRRRPRTLDEIVGQQHIIGKGRNGDSRAEEKQGTKRHGQPL